MTIPPNREPSTGRRSRTRPVRRSTRSTFPSKENMQEMLNMGMEEGLAQALGQIGALLA